MPTILFGHENSIFDSRIFLCTPAEINKSKNLWQKIPLGLIHQHETKKVVEQNDLAIRESILLKRTKKVDDEDSRKLNTIKQKIKEEILTRPIKIKKGC